VTVGLLALFAGCTPSPPGRDFALQDLLVNGDHYPSDWVLCEGPSNIMTNEGQEEGVFITFQTDAPVRVRAGEHVYRYASERKAAWHFRRFERTYFNDDGFYVLTPWTTPAELPYASAVANQSRFACAERSFGFEKTSCGFLGRYDEYLVFWAATMAAEGIPYMEYTELEVILRAIDQTMADHGLGQE
jgi:hypothetical protein